MWGPVNGEIAALGWPSSHLKREKKKAVDTQTKPDRLVHAPISSICASFFFFLVPIFPFPLNHFHFVSSPSVLFPSSPRHFLPISSSQVELCSTGLCFLPCTVRRVPCQARRVQGYSPGTDALATAQASVACALVSWQSSWKLNTLDCEIKGIAVI